jgi:excisionase family DNA binding protein
MPRITEVCTVKETAAIARVSPATIRRLIDAGRLPAMRVGRSVRIDRAALDRMLSKGGIR